MGRKINYCTSVLFFKFFFYLNMSVHPLWILLCRCNCKTQQYLNSTRCRHRRFCCLCTHRYLVGKKSKENNKERFLEPKRKGYGIKKLSVNWFWYATLTYLPISCRSKATLPSRCQLDPTSTFYWLCLYPHLTLSHGKITLATQQWSLRGLR